MPKYNVVPSCNEHLLRTSLESSNGLRLDGRKKDDYRPLHIVFGKKFGSVIVSIGNTRVMSTVTAEIAEPKMSRPSEGMLKIVVDLSPMASPYYDIYRMSDKQKDDMIEISRLLERSVRDARCLDMESLCIIVGKKAWSLETNVIVMNMEGNLIETCSIALMASLCHFKRPDVTVTEDGKVEVHDIQDKHPIPLTVFHLPFCSKFCFFERLNSSSHHVIVDPLEIEEDVCDGYIVVGANAHRELTAIHISGKARIDSDMILQCCHRGIERSKRLGNILKKHLNEDKEKRLKDPECKEIGFGAYLKANGPALVGTSSIMEEIQVEEEEEQQQMESEIAENTKAFRFMPRDERSDEEDEGRSIGKGGQSSWGFDDEVEEDQLMRNEVFQVDDHHKCPPQNYDDSSDEGDMVVESEFKNG